MDILEYFQADLDALRSLVIEVRTAEENSVEESHAFHALVSLVKVQDQAREALLHDTHADSTLLGEAVRRNFERAAAARDVEAMIECCTNATTWRSSVNIYCELLEARMQHDTREMLPALFDLVHTKELKKLGTKYKALRGFGDSLDEPIVWRKIWATILNRAG